MRKALVTVPASLAILGALLLPVFAGGCAGSAGMTRFSLRPLADPQGRTGVTVEGLAVDARPLTAAETAARLRALKWEVPAPAEAPGEAGGGGLPLLGFSLTIANGGRGDAVIDPRMVYLWDGEKMRTFPCDYTCLFRLLRSEDASRHLLEGGQGTAVDTPFTVGKGKRTERTLFMIRPRALGPRAHLVLTGVYLDGEPLTVPLEFEVVGER
jgi:hypothetical protein